MEHSRDETDDRSLRTEGVALQTRNQQQRILEGAAREGGGEARANEESELQKGVTPSGTAADARKAQLSCKS